MNPSAADAPPSHARQLALPLMLPAEPLGPFLPDASNAAALEWLGAPANWPGGRLALWGAEGVGKSHLLAEQAHGEGWRLLQGPALTGVPHPGAAPGIALDDADLVPEPAALFHLINACAEARLPLLLAGRAAPARWPVRLPDLVSRLRATTAVQIGEPSDALLRTLLARHFATRQLAVPAHVQDWLLARLPREAGVIADVARRLDQAALAAGGAVTRSLARQALADLPGLAPESDDVSMAMHEQASSNAPGLL